MLVLPRREGESFRIGDNILIVVQRIKDGSVRIGIEAPKEINIMRSELKPLEQEADNRQQHEENQWEARDGR